PPPDGASSAGDAVERYPPADAAALCARWDGHCLCAPPWPDIAARYGTRFASPSLPSGGESAQYPWGGFCATFRPLSPPPPRGRFLPSPSTAKTIQNADRARRRVHTAFRGIGNTVPRRPSCIAERRPFADSLRSEEHTSELQSLA